MLKHRRSHSKPELSAEELLAEIHDDPTIRSRSNLRILSESTSEHSTPYSIPTVGPRTSVGVLPTIGSKPSVAASTTGGLKPTVGPPSKNVRPIRFVQDALTATAYIVYDRMYGAANGSGVKICAMGYSEIARETGRHKDLVRDIIADLKQKGIVREIEKYDPDTRKPKKYEVLSFSTALQLWRDAGICYVTKARRPVFCDRQGNELTFVPTVGSTSTMVTEPPESSVGVEPTVGFRPSGTLGPAPIGTVGSTPTLLETMESRRDTSSDVAILRSFVEQTIAPMDEDAARKLLETCRSRAGAQPVTADDIIVVIRSKSAAARKADNPIGLLLTAVPKSFPLRTPEPDSPQQEHPVEDLEYWEQILTNPDATVSQITHARKLLAERS